MIVIGVDVHKQSVTAVAVDEAGRMLDERTVPVGSEELMGGAVALGAERLWAVEDSRLLTPWLAEIGPISRFRTDAQLLRHEPNGTGSTGAATGN